MPSSTDAAVTRACKALASEWLADATKRRALSARDVAADALDYCAGALSETVVRLSDATAEITVREYAALHGRPLSTVRRWCLSGALRARRVGRDWMIRRGDAPPAFGGTEPDDGDAPAPETLLRQSA